LQYLVSVIIPAFDAARFLPDALESVRAQTWQPFETIVVDDGSRDETAAIAEAAMGVRCVTQEHQGVAAARNTGMATARGDVLAFLDADDLWAPTKTQLQLEVLSQNPDVGYVLCHKQDFLEPGTAAPARLEPGSLEHPTLALVPSALLVRRAVVERVGGFDERFAVGEDREWFVRAEAGGIERVVLVDVLLRRRIHDANLTAHKTSSAPTGWVRALKAHIDRSRDNGASAVGTEVGRVG
jgi:glycosyltransferase involved in cell wall biosynthesis